jgi:outer membrane protein assembly factor BamB
VISLVDHRCEEVIYLGHSSGAIRVPPLCVSRYVIVAENHGARDSTLRVFVTNEEGGSLKLVQNLPLEGHVHVPPQLASSKTLMLCTDRGAFYAFDIGSNTDKDPLTRVAFRPATANRSTLRFCLARGAELWVADQKLDKYDVVTGLARLTHKWTENDGDVFLQPLEEIGDAIIHVRRKNGLPGVAVAAANKSDGKLIWETHLAAPLAGSPVFDSARNELRGMNLIGSAFQAPLASAAAIVEAPAADERAIKPVGPRAGGATFPGGAQVYLLGAGAAALWVAEPGQTRSRELRLPFPAAAAPVALAGNILVPTLAGDVVVLSLRGSPTILPFQPKLSSGTQISWLRPAVTANGDVLLADGAERLYRLTVEQRPQPHLEAKATAELNSPLATPLAVAQQHVFAGDSAGWLKSFALSTLSPGDEWHLGAPIAWGPVTVGDCVLVSTQGGKLYCFSSQPAERWQIALAYGPLAGDPALIDGKLVLASVRGTVWSLNPADGQETGRIELKQPLGSGVVTAGDTLVVAGQDGALHKIGKL